MQPAEYMKRMEKHHYMVAKLTEIECTRKKMSILSYALEKIGRKKSETVKEREEVTHLLDMKVKQTARMTLCQFLPLLLIAPFGMLMFGLNLAWNYLPFEPYSAMISILFFGTFLFQLLFFFLSIALQEMHSILNYIDLTVVIVSAVSDAYWSSKDLFGRFTNEHVIYYRYFFYLEILLQACFFSTLSQHMCSFFNGHIGNSILMGYMVVRSWLCVLNYNITFNPIPKCNKRKDSPAILDQLVLSWITRDASLMCRICPVLEDLFMKLCLIWGREKAKEFCHIEIYFTNNDEKTRKELERELSLQCYSLFREGAIKFERPSLGDIISKPPEVAVDRRTNNMNQNNRNHFPLKASRTLFVFCGSSAFASAIRHKKLLHDVALLMNNQNQQIDLVVESFGGKYEYSKKNLRDEMMAKNQYK